jgi:16S rRNA (uracil1498-N3)-methyltransferase
MIEIPYFYFPDLNQSTGLTKMDEEMRRHVVTVLRMEVGEKIMLMDGVGNVAEVDIIEASKKSLLVSINNKNFYPPPSQKLVLAISTLKNASRFEWMLEKVTEIGITEIIPLISERTERVHFKEDRLKQIIVSACLQSKQCWMPILREPQKLQAVVQNSTIEKKFIAHCINANKEKLQKQSCDSILLIGPEGDFTQPEIDIALSNGFLPVTLGDSRLRTETAGVVGAVLLKI